MHIKIYNYANPALQLHISTSPGCQILQSGLTLFHFKKKISRNLIDASNLLAYFPLNISIRNKLLICSHCSINRKHLELLEVFKK